MSAVWNQWQQTAADAQAEPEDGTPQATQSAIDLATDLGVDLNSVTGTGLHGKITKPDVEAAAVTDKQRAALLQNAKGHLEKTRRGWLEKPVGGGTEWKAAMAAIDKVQRDLAAVPKWANIGHVTKPGASLLDMQLTHKTGGIPLFPAVDLAWGAGVPMYAPEACVVDTHDTSASPGEAFFLTGASGMRYWFGHLDRDHPLGKKFSKGALIAKTVNQPPGKTDHGHVGVNAEKFLGKGKQLKYGRTGSGPDYTTGSPRIRVQLRESEL